MAFCGKCGSSVTEGVAFCPNCGAPVGAAVPPPPPAEGWSAPPPPPATGWAPTPGVPLAPASGLRENLAGCLCYALGWITGIIFLLIDKRPFVRFHAAQSIVVFGVLNLIRLVLVVGLIGPRYELFSIWWLLSTLVSVVTLVLWIVLMVFAYQGRRYEVPIAAGIAKSIAGDPTV
jgi:uncharacterized membrane protein